MHLLLVAFSAPPKNSAEAIQTWRFLQHAADTIRTTLITTPSSAGWAHADAGLAEIEGLERIELRLPLHATTRRILANQRLSALHVPDAEFWTSWMSTSVGRRLSASIDVIYSRSGPLSGAVLAEKLARILCRPWLMHLSDPWTDNPYRAQKGRSAARNQAIEGRCVATAGRVSMTTAGQVARMQARYPMHADKFFVSPNMMPRDFERPARKTTAAVSRRQKLRIGHVGSLYGNRNPEPLLVALERVAFISAINDRIEVIFVGNMYEDVRSKIENINICSCLGAIDYCSAQEMTESFDLLVVIEPFEKDIYDHFLLSKVVDYLAAGIPMLSIGPREGETARYCRAGYGWNFCDQDVDQLTKFLIDCIQDPTIVRKKEMPPPPRELEPERVAANVLSVLHQLAGKAS